MTTPEFPELEGRTVTAEPMEAVPSFPDAFAWKVRLDGDVVGFVYCYSRHPDERTHWFDPYGNNGPFPDRESAAAAVAHRSTVVRTFGAGR